MAIRSTTDTDGRVQDVRAAPCRLRSLKPELPTDVPKSGAAASSAIDKDETNA